MTDDALTLPAPALTAAGGASLRRVAAWAAVLGIWTALALLSVLQTAVYLRDGGQAVRWQPMLVGRLADWYTCAVFTPAYLWIARRFPLDRARWRTSATAILAATVVFVVGKYAMFVPLRRLLFPREDLPSFRSTLAGNFISEALIVWAVFGVVYAVEFYRRDRAREVQASALRAELAEARLDALAAQLHPHFLFNTLHGVSALMHRDAEAADTMLAHLSELLRQALAGGAAGGRHEIALDEELAILGHYLAIMKVRFHDRLTVAVDVEPGAEHALVPRFVLQPLVENALRHGIARRPGAGRVEVRARRGDGDVLHLSVTDDGAGLQGDAGDGDRLREGVGLSNTRRRIGELYGPDARLEVRDRDGGGLTVALAIPFRRAAAGVG
ncbi:MAG TPA: histidine kinase [Longimicrobiaceae bacterium]